MMTDRQAGDRWRYQEVAQLVRAWIDSGALAPGDRVRSVREMSRQSGFSIVTVHHAYSILESEGVLEARPRSGFYVADVAGRLTEFPQARADFDDAAAHDVSVPQQLYQLVAGWGERGIRGFGALHPSADLLPQREIGTQLRRSFREQGYRNAIAAPPPGDSGLAELIARRASLRGISARGDNVVVAADGQAALELCLDVVTRPGDGVLIESPSYFPLFEALRRRRLRAVEIYSHPKTGVDAEQFGHLLDSGGISACVLMPVNHYPTGVSYADEVLRRIVAKASPLRIPIIEYDIYGELSHMASPATTLKRFDTDDLVLQVGSFAATLGPQFDIGWILSGRFREQLLERQFFGDPLGGDAARQHAVAQYILRHSYDRHLRHMREELERRMRRWLMLAAQHFPPQSAISRPVGGYMCWARVPGGFDSLRAASRALQHDIDVLPGQLFSVTNSFRNFVALNFSVPPTPQREAQFVELAGILRDS